MATVDTAVETPVDPDTRLSARILRFLGRTPVHIVLVLIALMATMSGLALRDTSARDAGWRGQLLAAMPSLIVVTVRPRVCVSLNS